MKTQILSLLRELHAQAAKSLKSKHKTQHRIMEQSSSVIIRQQVTLDWWERMRGEECSEVVRQFHLGNKPSAEFLDIQRMITAHLTGNSFQQKHKLIIMSAEETYELWDDLATLEAELARAEKQSSALQRQFGVNLI